MSINIPIRAVSTFVSKGGHPCQEDFILIDREKGLFVVADGFGGAVPGQQAAKIACESVRHFLFKEAGDLEATLPFVLKNYFSLAGNVLFNSLIFANKKVNQMNQGRNIHEKGGASVLSGFIDGSLLALANVGVCQAWLFREGRGVELVVPRSLGKLKNPFLKDMPSIYQVPLIAVGMYDYLEPEIIEYRIHSGDWLIINTDGILSQVIEQIGKIQESAKLNKKSVDLVIQEFSNNLNSIQFEDNASISLMIF